MHTAKKLNSKHETFCREYLVDLNATQAAIRAGYSGKTATVIAAGMMRMPEVKARIDELKKERFAQLEIDSYYVLIRLKRIVEEALGEQEPKKEISARQKQYSVYAAIRALELIGKYLGMFTTNRLQMSITPEEIQNMSDDELETFAKKLGIQVNLTHSGGAQGSDIYAGESSATMAATAGSADAGV
ncbi:MAG TPA: terminase small subunit [Candidatus Kapabacteria bacterium]|nr:terminase small subunit [Candidatus Kapabacteria bacterium]